MSNHDFVGPFSGAAEASTTAINLQLIESVTADHDNHRISFSRIRKPYIVFEFADENQFRNALGLLARHGVNLR